MILQIPQLRKEWLTPIFVALALIFALGSAVAAWIINDPLLIVMGLVGAAAMVLTLYRIDFGLFVLVFITFTRFSDVLVAFHGAPSIAKVFVPVLLGVVIARWMLFRRESVPPWLKTAVILGVYGLVGFSSLLYAQSSGVVLGSLENYAKDGLIALVIVLVLRDGRTLRRTVWSLLLAALFLSVLTTYQQLTSTFENNYWGFAQAATEQIVTGTSDYRIAGPLSPNYYALVLIIIVPLAMDRLWHEKNTLLRLLAGITLFTTTISIIFTYSRGGFLALVVVAGLMLWHQRTKPIIVVAIVVAALIGVQFLPAQYKDRLNVLADLSGAVSGEGTAVDDSSLRGRQSEIIAAWQMFGDHPFIGVGLANYNRNYLDYAEHLGLDTRGQERSAHSLYLEIAAETGLIGIIAFGLILVTAFQHLYLANQIFLENGQRDYSYITWALGVGLVGYLTGSLFLHLSYARYFWMLIGLVIATRYVAEFEKSRLQTDNQANESLKAS